MKFSALLRRWLIAGLLIWLPLVATLLVLRLGVELLDQSLLLLPPGWRPEALFGRDIPGFGLIVSLVLVLATGATVANMLGSRLINYSERWLQRIPLLRSVYSGVKRLTAAVMSEDSQTFRKVVLLEYPRAGIWSLGFQTADPAKSIQRLTGDVVTVYVPTTPNPTSGFIIFVPRDQIQALDMPVEDALKMIMTLGVVTPEQNRLEEQATKP